MIRPKPGYILATRAKDTSKGYEVELPGAYKNVETGDVFYCTSVELQVTRGTETYHIVKQENLIADEVEGA